jgi:hypothetical protein
MAEFKKIYTVTFPVYQLEFDSTHEGDSLVTSDAEMKTDFYGNNAINSITKRENDNGINSVAFNIEDLAVEVVSITAFTNEPDSRWLYNVTTDNAYKYFITQCKTDGSGPQPITRDVIIVVKIRKL